jgi:hypothetical protein
MHYFLSGWSLTGRLYELKEAHCSIGCELIIILRFIIIILYILFFNLIAQKSTWKWRSIWQLVLLVFHDYLYNFLKHR